jgi:hypothetical protein
LVTLAALSSRKSQTEAKAVYSTFLKQHRGLWTSSGRLGEAHHGSVATHDTKGDTMSPRERGLPYRARADEFAKAVIDTGLCRTRTCNIEPTSLG